MNEPKYTLTVRLEPEDRYNLRLIAAAADKTIGEYVKGIILEKLYGKENAHGNNDIQTGAKLNSCSER
ncbi:hypothetical protein LCGC14_1649240 [marine sediment metagenome]|uniref:Toxin-antitoxin system HicB family antitoxin n=1 Tax=marine sediment metagenome TaxID=412755 RepID=A0A0F9KXJ2_9ZZZZ